MKINELTDKIISAAKEVHRASGHGLYQAEYEECLCYELKERQLSFERRRPIQMHQKYKGQILDCGYLLDLVVEDAIIVELNYCDRIAEIDKSRLMMFLKLSGLSQALLINFNVADLQEGIVRIKNNQHV